MGSPSFETVNLSWDNPDESYHLIVIEYLESEPDLINANMADMELPTQTTSSPIVVPGYNMNMRSIFYFGTYRIILYKINQEYADLYGFIRANADYLDGYEEAGVFGSNIDDDRYGNEYVGPTKKGG